MNGQYYKTSLASNQCTQIYLPIKCVSIIAVFTSSGERISSVRTFKIKTIEQDFH